MPFQSEEQRRYLWAKHPDVAQKFADDEKALKKRKSAESKSEYPDPRLHQVAEKWREVRRRKTRQELARDTATGAAVGAGTAAAINSRALRGVGIKNAKKEIAITTGATGLFGAAAAGINARKRRKKTEREIRETAHKRQKAMRQLKDAGYTWDKSFPYRPVIHTKTRTVREGKRL